MTSPRDPIVAVTHPNPYPFHRELAIQQPIYRDEQLGMWVVSSAETVTAALTSEACRVRPATEPVPRNLVGSSAGEVFRRLVRMNDGELHVEMKQAVRATLGRIDPVQVDVATQRCTQLLLDELGPELGRNVLDEVVFRLPLYTVGSLLGVPRALLPQTATWMRDFVGCIAPASSAEQIERGKAAAEELLATFRSLLASRGEREDARLLWRLDAEARAAGCPDVDIVIANGIGFLSQTCEATAGLAGNALLALATQPAVYRRVTDDRDLFPEVIREVLRYDPPIQNTRRFVGEDATIAERAMKVGDAILVVLAAANHDPSVNAHPERFELEREHRQTFTFGAARHACPGEALATTMVAAGVQRLIPTIADLPDLASSVTYRPSANARLPLFGSRGTASCGRLASPSVSRRHSGGC